MTGVARRGALDHLGRLGITQREKGPAIAREAGAVLDLGLKAGALALIVASVVDRTLADARARLQHEHGLLRPFAGRHERAIGGGRDEHVVEQYRTVAIGLPYG